MEPFESEYGWGTALRRAYNHRDDVFFEECLTDVVNELNHLQRFRALSCRAGPGLSSGEVPGRDAVPVPDPLLEALWDSWNAVADHGMHGVTFDEARAAVLALVEREREARRTKFRSRCHRTMRELTRAVELANRLLEEPNADPDDDLRLLSRQLLRRQEVVQRLQDTLSAQYDPTAEMIQANRDSILRFHEDAVMRVKRCLERGDVPTALKVLATLSVFHPMHGESWPGWPKESD